MTIPAPPDPARLRRSARTFLIWGIVCWALFALLGLGNLVSAVRPAISYAEPNAAYQAGRLIGVLLFVGGPLVLAIVFTVKQNTLRKQAEAIERAIYYPPVPPNAGYPQNPGYPQNLGYPAAPPASEPFPQNPGYPAAPPTSQTYPANPQDQTGPNPPA